jgi:NAD-dependent DNA ligase
MIFVLTGVCDKFPREHLQDWIKSHGGKATSAVSGKTT